MPDDWVLPKAWGEWALKERPTWTVPVVRMVAEKFRDHWRAQPGRDGVKADWEATWRNWVRREPDPKPGQSGATSSASPWFMSWPEIEKKAAELGIEKREDEVPVYFRNRVYEAAGVTPEMIRKAEIDAGRKPS